MNDFKNKLITKYPQNGLFEDCPPHQQVGLEFQLTRNADYLNGSYKQGAAVKFLGVKLCKYISHLAMFEFPDGTVRGLMNNEKELKK